MYCRAGDQVESVATNMADLEMRRLPVVDDHKRLVGIVSYLRAYKGHRYFIEAAAQLAPRTKNTTFLIVGEGPDEEVIRTQIQALQIEDRVRMLALHIASNMLLDENRLWSWREWGAGL